MIRPPFHAAAIVVAVPAPAAFAFLADPLRLGRWSLGCMDVTATAEPGVFTGASLFDGGRGFFSVDAHPAMGVIDYRVGAPDALVHRISARVVPGPLDGVPPGACLIVLEAWRPAGMTEDRWERLAAAHEAETWLIKSQLEAGSR